MKPRRARGSVSGIAVLVLALSFGCLMPEARGSVQRISVSDGWLAMGTFFEADLRVLPVREEEARAWLRWARAEIARLEKVYSRHDAESALSRLNRALAREDVLTTGARIDNELESVLFSSIEVWEATGGAFDMTIGPLVDLWGEAVARGQWPSIEDLRAAKRHVGSEGLLLLGGGKLSLTTPEMRIDLDGMAKGAALDQLRARLEIDLPGAAALLSFGESSILAVGDPDGEGWRLVVRSEKPSRRELSVLRLRDRALSVSSSVGSVSEIAGERVSHIIDPRTGSVIEQTVEAIVVADRAAIADGWSTGLLVVGANRSARRLVDKAGIEANVSDSSGRNVISEGWERLVAGTASSPE